MYRMFRMRTWAKISAQRLRRSVHEQRGRLSMKWRVVFYRSSFSARRKWEIIGIVHSSRLLVILSANVQIKKKRLLHELEVRSGGAHSLSPRHQHGTSAVPAGEPNFWCNVPEGYF